jgi:hypothetical protein
VAALGFADMGAYLADRVVGSRVLLAEIAAELGAHRLAARRLLDHHGIHRVRRAAIERPAGGGSVRSLRSPASWTSSPARPAQAVAGSSHSSRTCWSLSTRLPRVDSDASRSRWTSRRTHDRLRAGQPGQGLVAIAGQQQALQEVTEATTLNRPPLAPILAQRI